MSSLRATSPLSPLLRLELFIEILLIFISLRFLFAPSDEIVFLVVLILPETGTRTSILFLVAVVILPGSSMLDAAAATLFVLVGAGTEAAVS